MGAAGRRGAEFGQVDTHLAADPLAFLSAEHARQRALLRHLERLAEAPGRPGAAPIALGLIRWLRDELPDHMADEERSLHPRLEAFAGAGLINRLAAHHSAARRDIAPLLAGLHDIAARVAPPPDFPRRAQSFAVAERAHIAIEETEVAPLARRHVSPAGLAEIAKEIGGRRRMSDRVRSRV